MGRWLMARAAVVEDPWTGSVILTWDDHLEAGVGPSIMRLPGSLGGKKTFDACLNATCRPKDLVDGDVELGCSEWVVLKPHPRQQDADITTLTPDEVQTRAQSL